MNKNQANKIIAKYMNLNIHSITDFSIHVMAPTWNDGYTEKMPLYSDSIDALIPVWEKLKVKNFDIERRPEQWGRTNRGSLETFTKYIWVVLLFNSEWNITTSVASTFQEAACIATAKCIESLNE